MGIGPFDSRYHSRDRNLLVDVVFEIKRVVGNRGNRQPGAPLCRPPKCEVLLSLKPLLASHRHERCAPLIDTRTEGYFHWRGSLDVTGGPVKKRRLPGNSAQRRPCCSHSLASTGSLHRTGYYARARGCSVIEPARMFAASRPSHDPPRRARRRETSEPAQHRTPPLAWRPGPAAAAGRRDAPRPRATRSPAAG